jgi:hypothetical protein
MKVGVLTWYRREFEEIQYNNRDWDCYQLRDVRDLVGVTFDMFIRLDGWHKLDPDLLNTVKVQEKIRDLNKSKVKEDNTTSKRIAANAYAQSKYRAGGYVGLDTAQNDLTRAWENTHSFFPDRYKVVPSINVDSFREATERASIGLRDLGDAFAQSMFNWDQTITIKKEDLPLIINKDDIAGMP